MRLLVTIRTQRKEENQKKKKKVNEGHSLHKISKSVIKNGNDVTGTETNPAHISDILKMVNSMSILLFSFFFNNLYISNPSAITVIAAMM